MASTAWSAWRTYRDADADADADVGVGVKVGVPNVPSLSLRVDRVLLPLGVANLWWCIGAGGEGDEEGREK